MYVYIYICIYIYTYICMYISFYISSYSFYLAVTESTRKIPQTSKHYALQTIREHIALNLPTDDPLMFSEPIPHHSDVHAPSQGPESRV